MATDSAGKLDTIGDLVIYEETQRKTKYEFIIDLDVTSPLRSLEDLEIALEKIKSTDEALNIFSVSPANRNPYFNMVEKNIDVWINSFK